MVQKVFLKQEKKNKKNTNKNVSCFYKGTSRIASTFFQCNVVIDHVISSIVKNIDMILKKAKQGIISKNFVHIPDANITWFSTSEPPIIPTQTGDLAIKFLTPLTKHAPSL